MRIARTFFFALMTIAFAVMLEGCTCCAYLNHIFNADRNYEDATKLEQAKADSLPGDSEFVATGEAAKKYDKVIEKGSRVLERFPDNDRQTARAVFLIGNPSAIRANGARPLPSTMNSNVIFRIMIPCRRWNMNALIAFIKMANMTLAVLLCSPFSMQGMPTRFIMKA